MRPSLFDTGIPQADARNEAGGLAYRLSPRHALAQLAATGVLSNTFYATGKSQTDPPRQLAAAVEDNEFLARLALYSRQKALMKDMPAVLLLELSRRDSKLFRKLFPR